MLTLATNAIPVIRRVISHQSNPDEAGLRISPTPTRDQMALEMAPGAQPGDQVVVAGGARVFIDASIVHDVAGLELYAVAREGAVHLALREPISLATAE